MRMRMVDPAVMCKTHLREEHRNLHQIRAAQKAGKSLKKRIDLGVVELHNLMARHDAISSEMIHRGMKHDTPMDCEQDFDIEGEVDSEANLMELFRSCVQCRELIAPTLNALNAY